MRIMNRTAIAVVSLLLLSRTLVGEDAVDYLRDIKPILSQHCYTCHGGLKQESGLRLDTGAFILKGGDSGAAIELGRPTASSLVERMKTTDESERMPPDGEPLSAEEIELVSLWIEQGAKIPKDEKPQEDPRRHWSYQVPICPTLPPIKNADWASNVIDTFIASKHEKHGLTARPSASKSTILRRVYLDLVGLPPTRDQLHAFLADDSPDAFERIVDQLLASPRYGERWGRHWMDIWRYSDWYGRRGQNEIRYSQYHIWRWRDWIIESLNDDKGYDLMVVEMLAGDEVAPNDPDVLRATGFLGRNWYKFDRNVWLFETVEQTSMGLMAVTMRCARCHDHKYDPISQQDYYQLRAFFEPHAFRIDPVAGQPDTKRDGLARVYDAKPDDPTYLFRRGEDRNADKDNPLSPSVPSVLGNEIADIQPVSLPLDSYAAVAELIAAEEKAIHDAESALAKAKEAAEQAKQELATIKKVGRIGNPSNGQFLTDDFAKSRPDVWKTVRGHWEYRDGSLFQTRVDSFATLVSLKDHPRDFKARVRYKSNKEGRYRSVGVFFDTIGEQSAQAVYTSANETRPSVQAFHRQEGREVYPPKAIIPCEVQVGQTVTLEIEVRQSQLKISVDGQLKLDYQMPLPRQVGKFALWSHNGTTEFLDVEMESLGTSVEDAARAVELANANISNFEKQLEDAVAKLRSLLARIAAQRAGKLGEGDDPIPAKYPKTSTGRRLALARWITNSQNPRTSRVAVNHIWLRHFGQAIVPSVDNFGLAGKPPTHPELLDWLASEFAVDDLWSMKQLHRSIVTSHVYRMKSSPGLASDNLAKDPENKYLWRGNSRRMEAEVVRDSLLASAGHIDSTMGGAELDEKLGLTSRRRSLYFRVTPDNKMEMLELFDLANPIQCYERQTSVVPQQALAMTNSSLAINQARSLAGQLSNEFGDSDELFVRAAFQQLLSRQPTPSETSACLLFLERHRTLLADSKNMTAFPTGGSKTVPPSSDPGQRVRENLIHILFNHNDFVTIR